MRDKQIFGKGEPEERSWWGGGLEGKGGREREGGAEGVGIEEGFPKGGGR